MLAALQGHVKIWQAGLRELSGPGKPLKHPSFDIALAALHIYFTNRTTCGIL